MSHSQKADVQGIIDSSTLAERTALIAKINAGVGTGAIEATILADLRLKGVESYYLSGFKYTWTLAFWEKPALNVGGYIEAPYGPLGDTIEILGLASLRQADSLQFNGQNHKLTRSWLCAPNGHWDPDLYGA